MKALKILSLTTLIITALSCSKQDIESTQVSFDSYRYSLWTNLLENGVVVDFIGSQVDTYWYPNFYGETFDVNHEGVGAIKTDGVLANLPHVLSVVEKPDVVLLGIGINDILQGNLPIPTANNVRKIVKILQLNNPNVTILVEQVPGLGEGLNTEIFQTRIDAYNVLVKNLAQRLTTANSKVVAVDMNTDFDEAYFVDSLHYNLLGADFVAEKYSDAILSLHANNNQELNILPLGDSRVVGYRDENMILLDDLNY